MVGNRMRHQQNQEFKKISFNLNTDQFQKDNQALTQCHRILQGVQHYQHQSHLQNCKAKIMISYAIMQKTKIILPVFASLASAVFDP